MHNPVCYSRQRWAYPKDEDRNFVAAFFHLLTIILICTSVVQLNWFRIWGGHCTPYLSTNQFFGFGKFYATTPSQYHLKSGGLITSPSAYTIHYNTSSGCKYWRLDFHSKIIFIYKLCYRPIGPDVNFSWAYYYYRLLYVYRGCIVMVKGEGEGQAHINAKQLGGLMWIFCR